MSDAVWKRAYRPRQIPSMESCRAHYRIVVILGMGYDMIEENKRKKKRRVYYLLQDNTPTDSGNTCAQNHELQTEVSTGVEDAYTRSSRLGALTTHRSTLDSGVQRTRRRQCPTSGAEKRYSSDPSISSSSSPSSLSSSFLLLLSFIH